MRSWHPAVPLPGHQCILTQLPRGRIHHLATVVLTFAPQRGDLAQPRPTAWVKRPNPFQTAGGAYVPPFGMYAFTADLESRITPRDEAEWQKGSIDDWVMEGHRLAQTVAYEHLSNENPAPITPAYERQADPVIELQLEKAGVRLAYPLDANLVINPAGQNPQSEVRPLGRRSPDVNVWVNSAAGSIFTAI